MSEDEDSPSAKRSKPDETSDLETTPILHEPYENELV